MKDRYKKYQTQWAGQFGAAHELSRRGYLVTFTSGNAPDVDLLCQSPNRELFSVQVKSLSSRTSFICQKYPDDKKLFFILVVIPSSAVAPVPENVVKQRPEYFILNRKQFLEASDEQKRTNKVAGEKRGRPLKEFATPGVSYSVLTKKFDFCDAWQTLPG